MGSGVKWPRYCASNSPSTSCSVKFLEPTASPDIFGTQPDISRASAERKLRRSILVVRPDQRALNQAEHEVRGERHERGGNGAGKNHVVIDHGEAAKNKFAQPACSNGSGNRR